MAQSLFKLIKQNSPHAVIDAVGAALAIPVVIAHAGSARWNANRTRRVSLRVLLAKNCGRNI